MEMTGLDPEVDVILEIATIVTDSELNVIAEGPVLPISQPQAALARMDAWNTEHHTASGLIDRVRQDGVLAHRSRGANTAFSGSAYDARHVAAVRQYDMAGPALSHQVHAGSRRVPALPHHRRIHHQGTRPALASGACLANTKEQRAPRAGGHSRVHHRAQVLSGAVLSGSLSPRGSHPRARRHPAVPTMSASGRLARCRARAQSMCSVTISSASSRRRRRRSISFSP